MAGAVIAVDPGKHSGVAIFDATGRLVYAFEVTSSVEIERTLREYPLPIRALAIETQYRGPRASFPAIAKCVEAAGLWKGLARVHGAEVLEVQPAKWQSVLKCKGMGRVKRDRLKRLSRELAAALYGERAKAWSHNICDAVHIGRWALVELAIKRRVKNDSDRNRVQ
jgi:hypothetical protein